MRPQLVTGNPLIDATLLSLETRRVLTNAEILTLPGSTFALPVPALDMDLSGTFQRIASVIYVSDFRGGAYVGIDHTYCDLRIDLTGGQAYIGGYQVNDSTTAPPLTALTDFFENADQRVMLQGKYLQANGADPVANPFYVLETDAVPIAHLIDHEMALAMDNNSSVTDLTGGDPANTLTVIVRFELVRLA